MELTITEKEEDNSVKFRCDLCNFNPYQAWCKGSVARFHAALMKHKQSIRHKEAEAFANGEQPVSISKGGKVSADAERPPHFYISKLETMIDKLEQRIDALNSAYEPSEASVEDNLNNLGSLVGDLAYRNSFENSQKSGGNGGNENVHQPQNLGSLVGDLAYRNSFENSQKSGGSGGIKRTYGSPMTSPLIKEGLEGNVVPFPQTFDFKEMELKAMRKFGDGSCITNTNTLNAVVRCLNWCEVYIKDDARRLRNVSYLKTTIESIKSLCSWIAEGWRAEEDDYDEIGGRLDNIMEHVFSSV
jgi:hypothetical protein